MKISSRSAAVCMLLLLVSMLAAYGLSIWYRHVASRTSLGPVEGSVENGLAAPSEEPRNAKSTAQDALLQRDRVVSSVTLTLETEQGAPIMGAKVAAFAAADKVLYSDITDARGGCELDAGLIGEQVLIAHDGIAPILSSIPDRSHWRIRVPSFPAVEGRITVNGQSPSRKLSLLLRSSSPLLPTDKLSDVILASVGLQQHSTGNISTTTTQDGFFRISGLPAAWSGAISCQNYELRSEGQSINSLVPVWHELPAPCEGLVINLLEPPKFTGRVLNQADASPVSKGYVIVFARTRTRELHCQASLQENGEFAAYARLWDQEQVLGIRATVMPEGAVPVDFRQLVADSSFNLGDLTLPSPRPYQIRILAFSGHPVCGATAYVSGADIGCEPSGENGVLTIYAANEETVLEVEASGFLPHRESIAQALNNEASITLMPAASLRVAFKNPAGAPYPGARLLVLANVDWLRLKDWEGGGRRRVSDGILVKSAEQEVQLALNLVASQDGEITINGIDPQVPFKLLAAPIGGDYCYQESIADSNASSDHIREIVIHGSTTRCRGRVLDPMGTGCQPKSIVLSLPRDPFPVILAQPTADEDGIFYTDLSYTAGITVDIISDKYGDFRKHGVIFSSEGTEVTFQLCEGRVLSVWLEDEYGSPLDGIIQARLPSGRTVFASGKEGGRCWFNNLPREALTISALVGLASYEFEISPHETDFRALLPAHGKIIVQLPEVLEIGDPPTIAARITMLTDGQSTRQILRSRQAILGPFLPGQYRVELEEAKGFSFLSLGWTTEITVGPNAVVEAELSRE